MTEHPAVRAAATQAFGSELEESSAPEGALVATDNLNDAIIRGGAEGIKSRPIIPVLRVLFQDLRPVDRSDAGFLVGDEIIKKLWVVR